MKSILVIDDEENIQSLLEDILKPEGYRVIISDGGKKPWKFFARRR